ncbi:MAG: DUF2163 domain-containing protein [Paracoccaceae bacterium]
MGVESEALLAHLKSGSTTVCRAWAVTRKDGVEYGFTDHDEDLSFAGITFRARTGMSARALQQTTGLSVDNTEALGMLSDAAVREADILAGRFDGAEVRAWLVNWQDTDARIVQFRGTFGEITRGAGAFQAELRGLTEVLNQPQGRVYQKTCSAVLGDGRCRFNLDTPGYFAEAALVEAEEARVLRFSGIDGFPARWFERGRLRVVSGASAPLVGIIKNDRKKDGLREIELWEALGTDPAAGDLVRLEAGCDKRPSVCKVKFNNFENFRGFPHIPGEDWLMSYPSRTDVNDGGSLA